MTASSSDRRCVAKLVCLSSSSDVRSMTTLESEEKEKITKDKMVMLVVVGEGRDGGI